MTEKHDLVGRLLAAIGQRETAARDMAKMWPGDWELSDRGWMAKVTADGPGFREVLRLAQEDVPDGVAPDLGDLLRHLVLNDPDATLIHCAADRKILDLHAPVRVPPSWATFGLTRHMETTGGVDCKTCCDDGGGTSYEQRSGLEWPCPTIQALAERYDLTEQQGDQP